MNYSYKHQIWFWIRIITSIMFGHHRSCIRFNNVKPRFLKTNLCKMNINSWNIFVTSSQTIIFIVVITTRPLTVCFSFFNYFITSFSFGYNIFLEEVPPTQTPTQNWSRKADYAYVIIKTVRVGYHFKGSPDSGHFIFEINLGKSQIDSEFEWRYFQSISSRSRNSISESFYVGSASFRHKFQK